jgi:hypothetical protein
MPVVRNVQAAAVPLAINEFMAANGGVLKDPQGESDDWVEIYNAGSQAIDMAGMHLTDDPAVPRKWQVPTNAPQLTKIAAKGYLLIWLDGETTDSGLHASFALDSAGDRIALFDTDGTTLIDMVSFQSQRGNISYGRFPDGAGAWSFLTMPTPRAANAPAFQGVVADTKFSHGRGFYDVPFDVTVICATPGATIYYTVDGSEPAALAGRLPAGSVYSGPIRIAKTTCLRARAVKSGWLSSNTDTQTYIFLSDVITRTQAEVIARGYPDKWFGGLLADYEMDPQICTDPAYANLMNDAMLAIPTLSLVTNKDNFFSATNNAQTGGIYIYTGHSSTGGQGWERPVSVELFTRDGAKELQVDCGVRIQGGESRNPPKCPKHSLGLRFRSSYGPSRLDFPLFDGGPVQTFNSLELRGFFNNAWTHWDPSQRQRTQYIRDQWMHDSLVDMDNADGGRGFYIHLYINGIYWGMYMLQEWPVASHYAAYNGGEEDKIDAMNGGSATSGTTQVWNEAKSIIASKNWARIQQVIDIDNFIDWTLLGLFAGNQDLKTDGNWRAAGGGPDRRPWRFYSWDGERVLENVYQTGVSPAPDPTGMLTSLESIEEFRIRFGDRVHKHLFNGGALTPARNAARWTKRANEIDLAVIAESARWGDYRRDVHQYSSGPYQLYTKNAFWIPEKNRLLNDYFPRRTSIALDQFKSRGLYPSVSAPVFQVNGAVQHGGHIASRGTVSMQAPSGAIWYTLDGTDPRTPTATARSAGQIKLVASKGPTGVNPGAVAPTVVQYTGPVTLTQSTRVKARALSGSAWSALNEAVFAVGPAAEGLRVSEIMYHPLDTGNPNDPNTEFIELTNIADQSINLNLVRFTKGIDYTFPSFELPPAGYCLIVKDIAAFQAKYGSKLAVVGEYAGSLSNGGECVELVDAAGQIIQSFTYDDDWFGGTDGLGSSLTVKTPRISDANSLNDEGAWRPSTSVGGSPGSDDGGAL